MWIFLTRELYFFQMMKERLYLRAESKDRRLDTGLGNEEMISTRPV